MYSHAWRRSAQQIVLWKKGEQTVKQPVAVSDVVNGIVNAMLDRSTSGKTYQAVGYKYTVIEIIYFRIHIIEIDI